MNEREDRSSRAHHQTTFHGQVKGPVHTGSGDIRVNDLSYGVDERSITQLRDHLIARLDASEYRVVAAVVKQLEGDLLQEVQQLTTAMEKTPLKGQEMAEVIGSLRPAMAEAQEKGMLPAPSGAPMPTDIFDAPSLGVAHKLKLTIPIIPFLLGYEGEVKLESAANLEMSWAWLKDKLGR